jgi:alpha-glucosidase
MTNQYAWWQKGIIYQIYPRSYQDSNGDGIGDLLGIKNRLDYIQSLGVDAVWLSPIYPSPMHDFGYDVADYVDVNPMFGTMEDFDSLNEDVHSRGMKMILDLVPNHTSNEHEWFIESRSSKDNPKRDWYIWRDPAPDGGLPNNWLSFFGGPAWTFDDATGQYYLHQFVSQQPELNYRNPEVLEAMLNVMRFWLEKGVDGFRVDVIWLMLKDEEFRDEPINPGWDGVNPHDSIQHIRTMNLPRVHALIKRMRKVLDAYDERMMVGEIYMSNEDLVKYYGDRRDDGSFDECHLPFNFQLIQTSWDAQAVRKVVDAYEQTLPDGAWPNWVLGNHDQHRVASRTGPDQARIANLMLLTLRGTPTTYYGEEIGMENVVIPQEFIQDPPAVNQPEIAHIFGRDPERTPMQWDASPNAGFSDDGVTTWLPVSQNYDVLNTDAQTKNPTSMLNLYKSVMQLRKKEASLHVGEYVSVEVDSKNIFAYQRVKVGYDRFLIVLNFSDLPESVDLSHVALLGKIEISTSMQRLGDVTLTSLNLDPNEGLILRISSISKQGRTN